MARPKLDKTNAIRLLEAKRVPYEALTYDPEIHSAVGLDEGSGSRPLLVMIAGPDELDHRLLARSIGAKATRMAPQREAERLTGLLVGGIGALALVNRLFV